MKPIRLIGLLLMVVMVNVPEATAKKQYWKPKCERGTKLELGPAKMSFRCRTKGAAMAEEFREPTCEEGAILEQRSGKGSFRCRREGAIVEEFRLGRCERGQRLRRSKNPYGFNFSCQGTTIDSKGGAGTFVSEALYECPNGYDLVSRAEKPAETCSRREPGVAFEKPAF
jgi:hypothetical protein|tara:strand:+ start:238 stop:747 length:510 start_codon:yes stop_codon:yes gene_type:complete